MGFLIGIRVWHYTQYWVALPLLEHRHCHQAMQSTLKNWQTLITAMTLSLATARATDLVWIGDTGDWDLAANWSPAQIPTSADNVWITNNGIYTVTILAGSSGAVANLTLGGVSGVQTLAVDRATLTLNGAGVINPNGVVGLLVSQSVITGPGNLTVDGTINWANGSMNGTGLMTIGNSGVLSIGNGGVTLGRSLNNSGTVSWSGGNLTFSAGNIFNNQAGATFDITADGRVNGGATTPINNTGLIRLLAGSVNTIVNAPVNNSGALQVLAATISLNLGGTHTGTFSTAAGSTLALGGGNHVLSLGSLVTGAGQLVLNGNATLSANGTFDVGSSLNVSVGVATLAGTCNVTGATLTLGGAGGVILFESAGSVAALNVTAGTLGGSSPVTVTGLLTLSGGTLTNALVVANGGILINGNTTLNGTRLVNPGNAVWNAGNFTGANGAAFSNLVSGTFINSFDGNMASGAGSIPLFINAGLFQKTNGTAPAGTTSIDFQFINIGTVEVQTNTLRYGPNQQLAGLTLLDGGNLSAQAQPLQLLGGSLVGTGSVTVANVQNVINSSSLSPGSPLGRLDISGNYQQTSAGNLNIDLGGYVAGTDFDLITVTGGGAGGVATLGGTLLVNLVNGFSPTNGATFTFLTADTRAGSFATFNNPSSDIGMQISYTATSAQIKVTNLKPVVAHPVVDPAPVQYGATFNFQFAANTFVDPDNDPLTFSVSGMPPGLTFSSSTRTFSGAPTQTGVFPVTVTATDAGVPSLSTATTFNITVNPATLIVTAQPATKNYGDADPAFTAAFDGFVNGETLSSLSGTLVLNRVPGENAGSYPITPDGVTNPNYLISFVPAVLTISKVPLSITAEGKSKLYGAADPSFTATYAGFIKGETPAVLGGTLAFSRAPGENVASYNITPGGVTSANYAIAFNSGTLTIAKAPLTITADSKTKTYGAADPAFTATYAGFVNGETPTLLAGTLAFSRAPGENVGSYDITPGGLTSANYAIAFNASTLTISKATLTVSADSKTKTYGAVDPTFTGSYTGFVNGETPAVLAGTLTFSRAPGENVGNYSITPNGLTSANYAIAFNTGTLTITKAPLTVSADSKTKTYGAADPAFTGSYTGFVNGETPAVLAGTLTFSRAPGENVGNYSITPNGLTSANYAIAFNTGTLTITKAPLTVSADSKTKTYGAADPAFTASYAGLVNGESAAVLGGTLAFSRAPGENVGSYDITPGALSSANYAIAFNAGTLTITKAPLTVSADSKTKTYGAADPAFTASYAGFVNGETPAVLTATLTFSRVPGENVGSYSITPNGLTAANYAITFTTGTLTITKATLTITAENKTKVLGQADPSFTALYSGFVNGETPAVLSGTLSFSRAAGETVGSYSITASGSTSSNYTITFNPGTLTITGDNPTLLSLVPLGSGIIQISWTAISNTVYRVQYRADLNAVDWLDIAGDVRADTATATKTDTLKDGMRFYRVQVLP